MIDTKQGNGKALHFFLLIFRFIQNLSSTSFVSYKNKSKVTLAPITTAFLKYPEIYKFSDT